MRENSATTSSNCALADFGLSLSRIVHGQLVSLAEGEVDGRSFLRGPAGFPGGEPGLDSAHRLRIDLPCGVVNGESLAHFVPGDGPALRGFHSVHKVDEEPIHGAAEWRGCDGQCENRRSHRSRLSRYGCVTQERRPISDVLRVSIIGLQGKSGVGILAARCDWLSTFAEE